MSNCVIFHLYRLRDLIEDRVQDLGWQCRVVFRLGSLSCFASVLFKWRSVKVLGGLIPPLPADILAYVRLLNLFGFFSCGCVVRSYPLAFRHLSSLSLEAVDFFAKPGGVWEVTGF